MIRVQTFKEKGNADINIEDGQNTDRMLDRDTIEAEYE